MLVAYTPPGATYIDTTTVTVDSVAVPSDGEDHEYTATWDLRAWEDADPGRRAQHVVPIFRVRSPAGTVSIALQRSEEHTSELQSRENIVCRLLLVKKTMFRLLARHP